MLRPSWPGSALDCGFAAIAFDVHLEDGCVVDEAVDGGECHGGIWEDLSPLAEGLVGGDHQGAALVACADEFEENRGFGLILGDVSEVVEDQQVEFVELGDGGLEGEFATCDLELLDEVGGAGEQHAPAILDEGEADGCGEMGLSPAGRAEGEEIGAGLEPSVAGAEGEDLGLGDHRHGLEGEGGDGFSGRQPGFEEVALDAPAVALGDLVLGERGEEACGGHASLSARAAKSGQTCLMAGSLSSLSSRVRRWASTVRAVSLMRLLPGAGCHSWRAAWSGW